jgi:hypothetical protein
MTSGFFLGGGLAVLLALVGWSDQIKGSQDASRHRERDFLKSTGSNWQDLRALIRPSEDPTPEEKLASVLRILGQGGLKDHVDVQLIAQFDEADRVRTALSALYSQRFWYVFGLAGQMITAGVTLSYRSGSLAHGIAITWEGICVAIWVFLVGSVFIDTFKIAQKEEAFRRALGSIEDVLRVASDRQRQHERKGGA